MFGYLNLGNAKFIRDMQAQEAVNCRVDRGMLEYKQWSTSTSPCREAALGSIIAGGRATISGVYPQEGGAILWDYLNKTGDVLGIALPATKPTMAIETVVSHSLPVGLYEYIWTLYNDLTGEESIPTAAEYFVVNATQLPKFTLFPNYTATYPKKDVHWRVYRKSPGSGEFLFLKDYAPGVYNAPAYTDFDQAPDDDLGDACDTYNNNLPPSTATSIAYFSGKLWAAYQELLYFSKTDKPWAFPPTFQIGFGVDAEDSITGIYPYGEVLIVTLRKSRARMIYGDDESNFVVKEMDAEIGLQLNSGRIVAGNLVLAQCETLSSVLAPPESASLITGITVVDGARPVNVSGPIRSIFPKFGYYNGPGEDSVEPQTGTEENRFYILKVNATNFPVATSANLSTDSLTVVMDIYEKGFLTGDETATFRYRTKEFATLPRARYIRRMFVETEGTISVEVYLDGVLATTVSLSNSARKIDWFTVKPWRADSFSLRFVGQPGAIAYSFGVVDPIIGVGGK